MRNILDYYKMDSEFEILDQTLPKKCEVKINDRRRLLYETYKYKINKFSQKSGFTLTMKKKYHQEDDNELHREIHKKILSSQVWKGLNYIIIPEYTKKGNLHYHGVIWNSYQCDVMRAIKWWRRIFGFAKPELEIRDFDNWWKYITKDVDRTGLWTIFRG